MPKQKQFLQPKKKVESKKKTSLETANEYLGAGVDFEEAGEKWRAGDAAKSLRFFVRAIENYDVGLERFPKSFDLAYNKARIQYDVAQQTRLTDHASAPPIDWLQASLDAHRFALTLDQDNGDLLFNTAQLLTSVAETITEGKKTPEGNLDRALKLLQESLELFQRCLTVQEFQLTQAAQQNQPIPDTDSAGETSVNSNESDDPENEVWAAIVEPVTKDTLLDTCIAQLNTLTALCVLESVHAFGELTLIEEYYQSLQAKIGFYYRKNCHHQQEIALTKARFVCALSEAAYRNGRVELFTYEQELILAFDSNAGLDFLNDAQSLCEKAEAELNFNASVEASLTAMNAMPASEELAQNNAMRWKHITRALDSLTTASKIPDTQNLAQIHLRRGDCELLRFRLAEQPSNYDFARKSASTLLKNASVFYRSALVVTGRSQQISSANDEEKEAVVKELVTEGLIGHQRRLIALTKAEGSIVKPELEEMNDEGLLGPESKTKLQLICA